MDCSVEIEEQCYATLLSSFADRMDYFAAFKTNFDPRNIKEKSRLILIVMAILCGLFIGFLALLKLPGDAVSLGIALNGDLALFVNRDPIPYASQGFQIVDNFLQNSITAALSSNIETHTRLHSSFPSTVSFFL